MSAKANNSALTKFLLRFLEPPALRGAGFLLHRHRSKLGLRRGPRCGGKEDDEDRQHQQCGDKRKGAEHQARCLGLCSHRFVTAAPCHFPPGKRFEISVDSCPAAGVRSCKVGPVHLHAQLRFARPVRNLPCANPGSGERWTRHPVGSGSFNGLIVIGSNVPILTFERIKAASKAVGTRDG